MLTWTNMVLAKLISPPSTPFTIRFLKITDLRFYRAITVYFGWFDQDELKTSMTFRWSFRRRKDFWMRYSLQWISRSFPNLNLLSLHVHTPIKRVRYSTIYNFTKLLLDSNSREIFLIYISMYLYVNKLSETQLV